jgi:hypothetical protein
MGVNQGRGTNPIGVNCSLDEVFAGYGIISTGFEKRWTTADQIIESKPQPVKELDFNRRKRLVGLVRNPRLN